MVEVRDETQATHYQARHSTQNPQNKPVCSTDSASSALIFVASRRLGGPTEFRLKCDRGSIRHPARHSTQKPQNSQNKTGFALRIQRVLR
jgi:hypothetical protein